MEYNIFFLSTNLLSSKPHYNHYQVVALSQNSNYHQFKDKKVLIITLVSHYFYLQVFLHICKYNSFKYNVILYSLSMAGNNYKLINQEFFNVFNIQMLFDYILFLSIISTNFWISIFNYMSISNYLCELINEKNNKSQFF